MALESLPLVVHSLMPDWAAILTSTVIVLIAAEIVPQAFCTGTHKITIAYYASPIIAIMIKIFYPIAKPTAKLLDYLVGAEHDEKIQHKDFATFLNEDVTENLNVEISEQNGKVVVDFDSGSEGRRCQGRHDSGQ